MKGIALASLDILRRHKTNPNLLDNGWFTVNQRGVSSWSANVYGVDRWRSQINTITVNADGTLTIPNGTYIEQGIENHNLLLGKTVTASVLFSDGVIQTATFVYNLGASVDAGSRCHLDITANLLVNPCFSVYTYGAQTIRAVKLELGSISTLANDTVPNYAEELLKCQRYYEVIDFLNYRAAGCYSTNTAYTNIQYSVEKRTAPTITSNGTLGIYNGSTWKSFTGPSAYGITKKGCHLEIGGVGATSSDTTAIWGGNGSTLNLYISADL